MRGILDQDAAEWTEVFRVNLLGTFLAVKHAAALMKPAGKGSSTGLSRIVWRDSSGTFASVPRAS